ncbi:MAG: SDR family NAD(P)-dependent oxidoreductase, partial [Burkholderiales bacterium]|nr:SDR family NAD(P)-dependent oxidoreductase [Burkholderiales bacterium]
MRLEQKVAIVTGGGSGFGEGIATRFAQEGCRVIVNDINVEGGERVAQAIKDSGGEAVFCRANVASSSDWAELLTCSLDNFGKLDIVINNAGTTHQNKSMLDVTDEEFDLVYNVNVKGIYYSARNLVPYFRKQGGGNFVTIASTAGIRPRPGLVWYSGSKAAAIIASQAMAV